MEPEKDTGLSHFRHSEPTIKPLCMVWKNKIVNSISSDHPEQHYSLEYQ